MTTKTCSKCRVEKDVDLFHRGSASHGRCAYCKSCQSAHGKARAKQARETMQDTLVERACSRCDVTKPASDFHKSRRAGSKGRSFWCKACQADYYRERVQNDPDYFNKFLRKNRALRRQRVNAIKMAAGCVDCGENHPACLDFHHRSKADKVKEVCKLVDAAVSMATIEAEIAKCVVLCSNCHRKRHYNDKQAAAQSVA